jgi:phage shock protein A
LTHKLEQEVSDMALITRMSRLLAADLNAVLDHIEEPDVLLKQAIREMEEALASDELTIRSLKRDAESLGDRVRQLEAAVPELDRQLDLCLAAGSEELARTLTRRKLQAARLTEHLRARGRATDKAMAQRIESLEERRLKLEDMRQQAELLREEATELSDAPWREEELVVTAADVEVALMAEKEHRRPR